MHLAIVGTVHQTISSLQMTSVPESVRLGYSLFVTFETIRIVWHGSWTMMGGESPGENMFRVRQAAVVHRVRVRDRRVLRTADWSDHMRYMMLIHHDEEALADASKQQLWADYAAFNEALAKAGAGFAAGERLESSVSATTVRVRDGGSQVLDGPYADTKEQFAGYFMIDVLDLDEAITWARRCPSAKYGAIEIRPFMPQGRWSSAWAKQGQDRS